MFDKLKLYEMEKFKVYSILVITGIIGAWLLGLFEQNSVTKEVKSIDLLVTLLGLIILFGSVVGIFMVMGRSRQLMTEQNKDIWEQVRMNGRNIYIRSFIAKTSAPIILMFLFFSVNDYIQNVSVLKIFKIDGTLILITMVCLYYGASKEWNYNEKAYLSLKSPQI